MSKVITIRVDEDVKQNAKEVAESAGLTLSSVINSYLTQISATRRISIYSPEPMTPNLESLIKEVEAERAAGDVSKTFDKAEEFLADLKK